MAETDYRGIAEAAGLERVGARPSLGAYVAEAWRRRQFVWTLAWFRIEASLGRNRLGLLWIVLRPLFLVAIYGTIFGLVMPSGSRPPNFIPYLVVGVFFFEYFSKCLIGGGNAITGNIGLVKSLVFPRIILPAAVVVERFIEMIPMTITMFVVIAIAGEPITWGWFLIIPVLIAMTLFNFGVAALTARLTVHVADVAQVLPFVARLMFYSSGIFYALDRVLKAHPSIVNIAHLNPVADYINEARYAVVSGTELSMFGVYIAIAAAIVTPILGLIYFWRAEERYGLE